VKFLNWRILIIISLVISLTGAKVALANGDHQNQGNTTSSSHDMKNMDMSGKDKNMDMSGSNQGNDMEGMDMGHEPVKDTPANVKVLGTYGAVNLLFVLIGIWNTWFRRKGDSYGNA
jgi:hypothetical protein